MLIQIFTTAGLASGFFGALLVFIFTPKVDSSTYFHLESEAPIIKKRDGRKNRIGRIGMILIAIGFLVQLIVLWI